MVSQLLAIFFLLSSTAVVVHGTVSTAISVSSVTVTSSTTSSSPSPPPCLCNDNPPPSGDNETQFTCAQQKEFGKCDADFMLGFCECTCDRCCPCNDFPPTDKNFTCMQQKEFGKCDAEFLEGFCECTCDRCSALSGGPVTPPPADGSGCPSGSVGIFGSGGCESVRCAQNRQKCANACGGLTLIEFDCEDVTRGGSTAFSSSCACL